MGDYKSGYSTNSTKTKKLTEHNKSIAKKWYSSEVRANKYRDGYDKVNINDIVAKFAPGSKPYIAGIKMIYSSDRYSVITDMRGGYLRVIDYGLSGGQYITLSGESINSLPKSQREQKTHFYILKRSEMK